MKTVFLMIALLAGSSSGTFALTAKTAGGAIGVNPVKPPINPVNPGKPPISTAVYHCSGMKKDSVCTCTGTAKECEFGPTATREKLVNGGYRSSGGFDLDLSCGG